MTAAFDVLIVGGGAAGLRAAIAVAETDPTLRIAVVSKVYPMRSHTVSAEGGAAGVIASGDTLDEHAHDTVSGSDWLAETVSWACSSSVSPLAMTPAAPPSAETVWLRIG